MPDHLLTRACAALRRVRQEERGMTLVEVMVAAMVLLIAIVPTVKVFDDSRDQNATGERHEIALLQAQQALEEMRGLPYNHLALNAAAADPGDGRLQGSSLQLRSDLSEPLVDYSTEGMAAGDAWVDPVSQVTTGSPDAPVTMTVYRFVTWRDEECRVADLSGLGTDQLPGAIDSVQGSLSSLLDGASGSLTQILGSLSGSDKTLVDTLKARLGAFQSALADRESQLDGALSGVTQLDLCDINTTALQSLQELGDLTPSLGVLGPELDSVQGTISNLLNTICLPLVGCVLSGTAKDQIDTVNGQLDCMFGAGTSTQTGFSTYLQGVTSGLSDLSGDLYDTQKNTKRITAAVVIEPRNGVGPSAPVWATSVVRDPSAGLLTGGGTSCSS